MAELSFQGTSSRLLTFGSEEDNKEDNLEWYETPSAWQRSGLTAPPSAASQLVLTVTKLTSTRSVQQTNTDQKTHLVTYRSQRLLARPTSLMVLSMWFGGRQPTFRN